MSAAENTLISVLCFSKDRPLQLEAYLTSLLRFCKGPLNVKVLYTCAPQFDTAYKKLRGSFPQAEFVRERNFREQVLGFAREASTPLLMFGCDDVLFKGPWDPQRVLDTFRRLPRLLAFSLRLGREITYCHPANRSMSLPRFIEMDPFLVWRWREAEVDWAYPWELDCTIYSAQFARGMLRFLDKRRLPWRRLKWSHPNLLEGVGAGLVARVAEQSLMACYPSARASVVTVNRVQDIEPNRVYDGSLTVDALLQKWNNGLVLDIDHYIGVAYTSIHIGDVSFTRRPTQVSTTN